MRIPLKTAKMMLKGLFCLTKLLKRRKITSDTKINEKQKTKTDVGEKHWKQRD